MDGITAEASSGKVKFDFTKQTGFLMRKAFQRNQTIYNELCVDPTMTSVQFAVLYAVADLGPCSLTVIGKVAATDPATTRSVIDRLDRRGLVALSSDASDRRKVIVAIEPAGQDLVAAMSPRSKAVNDRFLERLNPAERVALDYLLQKLCDPADGEQG